MNSKWGVQSKRRCGSHESCVCIAGFPESESDVADCLNATRGDRQTGRQLPLVACRWFCGPLWKTVLSLSCGFSYRNINSVQFSSRWYVCAWKSPYALHPVSQKFPQRCLSNGSNVRLIDDAALSSFQGISSGASSFHASLLRQSVV